MKLVLCGTDWRKNLRQDIESCYSNAPNFEKVMPFLNSWIAFNTHSLSEFNINAIVGISGFLGFTM